MSAQDPGPGGPGDPGREPTEEELRAALEDEMRRVTVDQILLQSVVSLINIAGRKLGLAPGAEGEKDLEQVRTAIDAVRALLPVLESKLEEQDGSSIRNALSQLQMAYAQEAGGEPPPPPGEAPPKQGGEPPQQGGGRSSGLWVPGQ
jgi:Domain of unknown function (DUF1844)